MPQRQKSEVLFLFHKLYFISVEVDAFNSSPDYGKRTNKGSALAENCFFL